jgi:ketosteroid isomerase-like protein
MELHRTLDPRTVVADYDYEVVATTTGRRARVANVQIVTVEAGRITRSRDFHDHVAMAALLGAADRAEGPSAGKGTSA